MGRPVCDGQLAEVSFYERSVPEIVDDLELLGFDKYAEPFTDDADYPHYNVAFSGQPEDNAVEDSYGQEVVSLGSTTRRS